MGSQKVISTSNCFFLSINLSRGPTAQHLTVVTVHTTLQYLGFMLTNCFQQILFDDDWTTRDQKLCLMGESQTT